MLVRCLYASRPAASPDAKAVETILEQSRRNNPAIGVTGLLCVADNIYLQVIEGGRDEVCELFNTIVRDDRHVQVRLLVYEEIGERRFGNWTMGQISVERLNPSLLLKYFRRAELNPFEGSGQASLSLLAELIGAAAINMRGESS
jgi:hypothetical protein